MIRKDNKIKIITNITYLVFWINLGMDVQVQIQENVPEMNALLVMDSVVKAGNDAYFENDKLQYLHEI